MNKAAVTLYGVAMAVWRWFPLVFLAWFFWRRLGAEAAIAVFCGLTMFEQIIRDAKA